MGLFDWFANWFSSNEHNLNKVQREEIRRLLDRMREEMNDNINSSNSATTRRLETLISSHTRRLNSTIEDSKEYCQKEIKRMSDELENVKKQLDEEKKKGKEKKQKIDEKREEESKARENKLERDYEKMLEMTKLMMEQQKLFMEQQKSNNCGAGYPGGFPPHPGYAPWQQPPAPSPAYSPSAYSAPPFSDVLPAPSVPPASSVPFSSSEPPVASAPPFSSMPPTNPGIYPNLSTLASPADSNNIKNVDRNENTERKIADNVKNFFLKDRNQSNPPKQRVSGTNSSSHASVTAWLQNNENCDSDDDSQDSAKSEVSVQSTSSRFSSVSVTSGKRVFKNKARNYGKPAAAVNSPSQPANKNKSYESKTNKDHTNSRNGRRVFPASANQNRHPAMPKDEDAKTLKEKSSSKHSKLTPKDNVSVTSAASSSGLTEIHYPSEQVARKKNLNLSKPLERDLLFLGKNEDDEWTTHKPKCLMDIYDLEKKYKVFRIIHLG